MNNIKLLLEAFSSGARNSRGNYHITLKRLIITLNTVESNENSLVKVEDYHSGFTLGYPHKPHSYRGYYSDLAFEISDFKLTSKDFLDRCICCLDKEFEGYKGGLYKMDEDTPLWIADYGSCGKALIKTKIDDNNVILVAKDLDENY